MALWRCDIQLAIPMAVWDALPAAKKIAARDTIRDLKTLAVKINKDKPEEEMTVRAEWHVCRHDEGKPCDEPDDI